MTRAALTEALDAKPVRAARRPSLTGEKIARVIAFARKAGHTGPIEFLPDGTIRLLPESADPAKDDPRKPEAW